MNAPQVSYVLATDTFETVREVVRAVAGQTVKGAIELVIVCPSQDELGLEPEAVDGIGKVRVIDGTLVPFRPRAAGTTQRAHCLPRGDAFLSGAELPVTLLAAHRKATTPL
jgi:hypothetical protein